MSSAELVIFDCDGVLVDSEGISTRLLAEALTAAGLRTTSEEAREEYLGPRLQDVMARAEERLGRKLRAGWLSQFECDRAEAFRKELMPVAGAAEAVTRIVDAGIAICVASQAKLEKTRLTLGLTGLACFFTDASLFSAEEVAQGKPHPDLFLHAAEVMRVAPSRCIVVEDTARGVVAAVSAGMRPLGFAVESDADTLGEAGAETFTSLAELPRLLGIS